VSAKKSGQVITFYSYKGGTGRSMALANVACLLARGQTERKGILVIDWDMEAPGLHRFFRSLFKRQIPSDKNLDQELDVRPGLIELFQELDKATNNSDFVDKDQSEELAGRLFNEVKLERFILKTDLPSLHLLKAGRFDEDYPSRVNAFDWQALYNRAPWLFQSLAKRLGELYQYILIDSRTGFTDISGICTMLMPEKLVVVFTPNRQSLTGLTSLVQRATHYRRQSDDLRPLVVFPLPARIETSEGDLYNWWRFGAPEREITGYQPQFENIFKEVYGLSECNLKKYFNEVQISHSSAYAYGEEIAVLVDPEGHSLSLTRAYQNFALRLIELVGPWQNPALHLETWQQQIYQKLDQFKWVEYFKDR